MKKIISILVSVCLIVTCLYGCGAKTTNEKNDASLKIVTTVFPQTDFLRQITNGVDADIKMLISPGVEVHGFEASISDIASINSCDLFVYLGGESDEWVEDVMKNADTSKTKFISLCEITGTVSEETVAGMENEAEEHEEAEEEFDEHVFTSPKNAIKIVNRLCDELCKISPENAEIFKGNTDNYLVKLKQLDKELTDVVASSRNKTLVFAERFPFRYLVKDYGLDYYAAFKGCSSSTEPSLSTINFLINKINEKKIPVVFYIEFSTQKVADKISQATGAEKLLLHSTHNVSPEDFENGVTYYDLMEQNIKNIKTALS